MKVLGFEDKNLYRQAREGHLISNFKGNYIMNGRGDCGQNIPPKLEVEGRSFTPLRKNLPTRLEVEGKSSSSFKRDGDVQQAAQILHRSDSSSSPPLSVPPHLPSHPKK